MEDTLHEKSRADYVRIFLFFFRKFIFGEGVYRAVESISVAEVVECAADEIISPEAVGRFAFAAVNVENEELVFVDCLDYLLAQ